MPIIFKSKLSSSVANQTFLDKTIDDIKKGKLTLYKVTLGEADQVEDVQVFLNELADVDGVAGEGDTSAKTYSSEQIIANGDDRKVAIGKLDAQVKLNQDGIADLVSLSGVGANSTDLGTFTGTTIPDASDIKDALQSLETAHEEVDQNVNDLITLSGVAENSINLGVFDHTIIADNETIKGALQDLEDGIKAINDDYGVAGGLATLDGTGKVPSTQLPSYVDDVLEYANLAAFPLSGEASKIYVALDTNKTYRWSGSTYIEISPSEVTSVNGYTGAVTLSKSDIGLSSVTNDAQLKRSANDFTTFTQKTTPVNADVILIEDSADSFNKKKVALSDLNIGGAVTSVNGYTGAVTLTKSDIGLSNVTNDAQLKRAANDFTTFTEKVTPVDADIVLIEDSADSFSKKKVQLSNLGLGAGVGGINYIDNYDFEKDTNGVLPVGWATYADTAGLAPVNGTGGTPNTTFLATTTTPLRGTKSAILSKNSGASRQGEGASYAFTIDSADQAQVLRISFDYSTSANYADGEIRVYVYDVTNSRLIEVVDRDLLASTQGKFVGTFQTSPDSLSYRLILHITDTDTLQSWTVEVDNVIVGPQTIVKGAIVTDWESDDSVVTFSNVTGVLTSFKKRIGDTLSIKGTLTLSSAPTGVMQLVLASGYSLDFTKISSNIPMGTISFRKNSVPSETYLGFFSPIAASNSFNLLTSRDTVNAGTSYISNNAAVTTTTPFTWASGDLIRFEISDIPIQGWSSNVVLSEDAGNREIATSISQALAQSVADGLTSFKVGFSSGASVIYDTASIWDTTNLRFNIPETGIYDIWGTISFGSGANDASNGGVVFVVNGNGFGGGNTLVRLASGNTNILSHSASVKLNKGDYVELNGYWNDRSGSNLSVTITAAAFNLAKRSSPQTIAVSEVVAASYKSDSVTNAVSTGSGNILKFEDLFFDTHNAYDTSTGHYTVPISGKYSISAYFQTASFAPTAETNAVTVSIAKEIAGIDTFIFSHAQRIGSLTTTSGLSGTINGVVDLIKGDKISIWGACSVATTLSSTNNRLSTFSIHKINGVS